MQIDNFIKSNTRTDVDDFAISIRFTSLHVTLTLRGSRINYFPLPERQSPLIIILIIFRAYEKNAKLMESFYGNFISVIV